MNMALQASRTSIAPRSSLPMLITWAVILALLAMSWRGADMRPMDLLRDSGNMAHSPPTSSRRISATGACTWTR